MKRIIAVIILLSLNLIAQDELTLLTTIHGVQSVEALGDVNGDGYNDFVAAGTKGTNLYFGGSPFDTNNCIRFNSNASYNGVSAGKGDLNGDGYTDFVLGANYDMYQIGKVFIHFGGGEIDTTAGMAITGQGSYYKFGSDISINGDLNGDGYDDLVVSAPNDDYDARGRVYVYFGSEEMDTECDVYLEGEEADEFGSSVSIVGDANGDGYDDFLVGAPQTGKGEGEGGEAFLFYGGDDIGFDNSVIFEGEEIEYNYYGIIVSGLGDINNDNYNDFGILADDYIDIYSGKILEVLLKINSDENYWGAMNISNGFDLNKDGYNDFIIGYNHQENQYTGDIAIYLGSNELDTVAAYTLSGKTQKKYFGRYIAIPGDIDNDGYYDILVGERGATESGQVFIYAYNKLTSIEETSLPTEIELSNNYPNPFNPATTVKYTLPQASDVTVEVFDISGRKIKEIFSGLKSAGEYTVNWDSTNDKDIPVASGVYFMKFIISPSTGNIPSYQKVIKMMLMK